MLYLRRSVRCDCCCFAFLYQLFSKALVVTLHCLKSAHGCSGDDGVCSFLDSLRAVLRRSLCAVDWNIRDTAVEFIDRVFLTGWSCLL